MSGAETASRPVIPLNDDWQFARGFSPQMCQSDYMDDALENVRLPHTVVETPLHYFSELDYQMVSGYRKVLEIPSELDGKVIQVTFEGAAHHGTVYLNGKEVMQHRGGYTAFTADLTPHVIFGGPNVLAVRLDSREEQNIPPFGHVIDYMTYGGLYREAFLSILSPSHIKSTFVTTPQCLSAEKTVKFALELKGPLPDKIRYRLWPGTGSSSREPATPIYEATENVSQADFETAFTVENIVLWDLDTPQCYTLEVQLLMGNLVVDVQTTHFGFREAVFKSDGFYLNGKKVKLIGLNRHQSYPYVGYAMPKRPQQLDADILKYELGINAVRTAHYPQSQHFMDRCDQIGLLVFTELPGWQHIGDQEWQANAVEQVAEMVHQYRNHPSIILWGVRINESQDNDGFYLQTNEVARRLDPTRQTGGVRYLKKSSLLEDVYTYNDFYHSGKNAGIELKKDVTGNMEKAYLVSEFNGHMYPTKGFDNAQVRTEHTLRHVRVLDGVFAQEDVAGGFGWCMFDYNTHKDFGSGDGICYHGVLDMFRNHKMAAAAYSSQSDLKPVLQVCSEMGIGDYPAGYVGDVCVLSNAETVALYKNDVLIKSFTPDKKGFAHLPNPPFMVDDLVGDLMMTGEGYSAAKSEMVKALLKAGAKYGQKGLPLRYKLMAVRLMAFNGFKLQDGMRLYSQYIGNWGDRVTTYRFDAISGGEVVKSVSKGPVTQVAFCVTTDTHVLFDGHTYDVATVRITAVDQFGNVLPYYQEPIALNVSGPLALIGPSVISFKGGMCGTYVKSTGERGTGALEVRVLMSQKIQTVNIDFDVRPSSNQEA